MESTLWFTRGHLAIQVDEAGLRTGVCRLTTAIYLCLVTIVFIIFFTVFWVFYEEERSITATTTPN